MSEQPPTLEQTLELADPPEMKTPSWEDLNEEHLHLRTHATDSNVPRSSVPEELWTAEEVGDPFSAGNKFMLDNGTSYEIRSVHKLPNGSEEVEFKFTSASGGRVIERASAEDLANWVKKGELITPLKESELLRPLEELAEEAGELATEEVVKPPAEVEPLIELDPKVGEKYASKHFKGIPMFQVENIREGADGDAIITIHYLQPDGKKVGTPDGSIISSKEMTLKDFNETANKAGWNLVAEEPPEPPDSPVESLDKYNGQVVKIRMPNDEIEEGWTVEKAVGNPEGEIYVKVYKAVYEAGRGHGRKSMYIPESDIIPEVPPSFTVGQVVKYRRKGMLEDGWKVEGFHEGFGGTKVIVSKEVDGRNTKHFIQQEDLEAEQGEAIGGTPDEEVVKDDEEKLRVGQKVRVVRNGELQPDWEVKSFYATFQRVTDDTGSPSTRKKVTFVELFNPDTNEGPINVEQERLLGWQIRLVADNPPENLLQDIRSSQQPERRQPEEWAAEYMRQRSQRLMAAARESASDFWESLGSESRKVAKDKLVAKGKAQYNKAKNITQEKIQKPAVKHIDKQKEKLEKALHYGLTKENLQEIRARALSSAEIEKREEVEKARLSVVTLTAEQRVTLRAREITDEEYRQRILNELKERGVDISKIRRQRIRKVMGVTATGAAGAVIL